MNQQDISSITIAILRWTYDNKWWFPLGLYTRSRSSAEEPGWAISVLAYTWATVEFLNTSKQINVERILVNPTNSQHFHWHLEPLATFSISDQRAWVVGGKVNPCPGLTWEVDLCLVHPYTPWGYRLGIFIYIYMYIYVNCVCEMPHGFSSWRHLWQSPAHSRNALHGSHGWHRDSWGAWPWKSSQSMSDVRATMKQHTSRSSTKGMSQREWVY